MDNTIGTFTDIHSRYYPYVRKILTKYCSENSVEDVCQDAFLEAYRSIDSLIAPSKLRFWLGRLASRVALKHKRKKHKAHELLSKDSEVSPLDFVVENRQGLESVVNSRGRVVQVIGTLEPQDRVIVRKIWVEGYSSLELAKELGMSASTLRSRVQVLRKRIQQELPPV